MKTLVITVLYLSLNAQAALLNDGDLLWNTCEFTTDQNAGKEKACHLLSTTTSLPTVLIDDVEIEQQIIEAEILKDEAFTSNSILSERIAQEENIEVDEVKKIVRNLIDSQIDPTIKNVKDMLK